METPQPAPDEDYQAASNAADDYVKPEPRPQYVGPEYYKGGGLFKRIFLYLLVLVLIAAAGAAVYWFKFHKKAPAKPTTAAVTTPKPSGQITSQTKHYDSTVLNLGLDYPADWSVNDNGDGKLTVVSPVLQLKSAAGQTQNGKIVLAITPKGQNLAAFDAGNGVAAMDSQKITYTNPTPSQRANTYLTFVRYAGTTTGGALDAVYITGDFGYQKGQAVPQTDVAKIDPEVVMSFTDSNGRPLSLAASAWDDSGFSGPLEKIFTSLSIE